MNTQSRNANEAARSLNQSLEGVTVLDLTQNVAGPYCTMILGDLGADVIKIERPKGGDDARSWGPPFWEAESTPYLALNRNKRSLALDIGKAPAREVLWRLVERADVIVQSLRPGSLDRLGLGYEAVRIRRPSIIYCSISAYGAVGPMRDMPGYDPLMQAFGGLMSMTGEPDGQPVRVGTSIIDMGTGLWGAIGVLSALLQRGQDGPGQHVQASLYETALGWIPYQIASYLATERPPRAQGSGTAYMVPYEAYKTRDGHIMIAAANDRLWAKLCGELGLDVLIDDPRFRDNPSRVRNREAVFRHLSERIGQLATAELEVRLSRAGIPCAPIRSLDEVVADEQTLALGMIRQVQHPTISDYADVGLPISVGGERPPTRRPPPALGADGRDILHWLGLADSEVETLIASGTVAEPTQATPSNNAS